MIMGFIQRLYKQALSNNFDNDRNNRETVYLFNIKSS